LEATTGTVLETAIVSGYRIQVLELAGSQPEPETGIDSGILLVEFTGNPLDPAVSCRTSLTWGAKQDEKEAK
jgi:hypothetical protein